MKKFNILLIKINLYYFQLTPSVEDLTKCAASESEFAEEFCGSHIRNATVSSLSPQRFWTYDLSLFHPFHQSEKKPVAHPFVWIALSELGWRSLHLGLLLGAKSTSDHWFWRTGGGERWYSSQHANRGILRHVSINHICTSCIWYWISITIVTWYFMSMLKNSSLGSCELHASHKCSTLFCAILIPSRSPILALWSSSLRLWELAIRSKNSSVWVSEMREEAPDSKGDWGMEDWGPVEASWAWALGCWGSWQRRFSMLLLLGSLSTVKGQTSLEVTGTYP